MDPASLSSFCREQVPPKVIRRFLLRKKPSRRWKVNVGIDNSFVYILVLCISSAISLIFWWAVAELIDTHCAYCLYPLIILLFGCLSSTRNVVHDIAELLDFGSLKVGGGNIHSIDSVLAALW